MRILLADDEQLVRFSLKSMLEEIGIPARCISVARDGEELVAEVARTAPDVAFVDIRMPRLDGLAGIERARARSPATRWVILTSYSSFDYAKKALELGASGYLLKPVSPDDLRRVLERVASEQRRELLRRNDEFEACVASLLHGALEQDAARWGVLRDAVFAGSLIVFDGALEERESSPRGSAARASGFDPGWPRQSTRGCTSGCVRFHAVGLHWWGPGGRSRPGGRPVRVSTDS